jgi:hypothetical protein
MRELIWDEIVPSTETPALSRSGTRRSKASDIKNNMTSPFVRPLNCVYSSKDKLWFPPDYLIFEIYIVFKTSQKIHPQ